MGSARSGKAGADARDGKGLMVVIGLAGAAGLAYCASFGPERFTDALGVVALGAFGLVLVLVVGILLKDASRRSARGRSHRHFEATKQSFVSSRAKAFKEEVERLEQENAKFFEETVAEGRGRFGDLVRSARAAMAKVAKAYGSCCKRGTGSRETHLERFSAAFTLQWSDLKSDLGYMAFSEFEARLLNARESWQDWSKTYSKSVRIPAPDTAEDGRAQALGSLMDPLRYDRLHLLRCELNDAQKAYGQVFDERGREWVNQAIFRCVIQLREQGREEASIADTNMKGRIARLKSVLEVVGRLSDRLTISHNDSGDERATLSRLIFACIALDVLAHMPEWFPEMGELPEATDASRASREEAAGDPADRALERREKQDTAKRS